MFKREQLLFLVLGGFFICNALIAEFIGVKIFSLEKTLGFEPMNLAFFGEKGLSFNMTAGVLLWPGVFILTDIINEYYGMKGVKVLSWLTAILIAFAFLMVFLSMQLTPADFWLNRKLETGGTINMNNAFNAVFGQGLWIIIGSLAAFLVGQLVDVKVFHSLKRITGASKIWLRATGSTLVSQLVDSFIVLFIAFYIGAGWSLNLVLAICLVNYIYKFLVAILLTPLLYLIHGLIDQYLGQALAHRLMDQAHRN